MVINRETARSVTAMVTPQASKAPGYAMLRLRGSECTNHLIGSAGNAD